MSDERRERYAAALREHHNGLYEAEVQAITTTTMAIADEELQQLEDAFSKERARAEVAEQQRDGWRRAAASYCQQTADHLDNKAAAEKERNRHAADAVRYKADLLTARHDLHEFHRELEEEREEHAAEVADLRATIDDLRAERAELRAAIIVQAVSLARQEEAV
ncbi:hypothetical protein [Streptomyces asiaticus]|uniref:hypothetical protein n=1 Tax=Streptomyces asiaticus TaxID=114695 RepID=UPI001BA52BD2|nr:hypothetical protein [Streptomyces asiaticus]